LARLCPAFLHSAFCLLHFPECGFGWLASSLASISAFCFQICQLSLWIKTAARGKQLTSLDHTIREGNGIISDPAVHPKAFDWQAAFLRTL
jgi:hypothetical protein